jgi:hypothetical protein
MDLKGMTSGFMGGSSNKIQEILQGVNFPAGKQDIINKAKEAKADNNIMSMLGKLKDMKFQSPMDVMNGLK